MTEQLLKSSSQIQELLKTHRGWLGTMSKAQIEGMSFGQGKQSFKRSQTINGEVPCLMRLSQTM